MINYTYLWLQKIIISKQDATRLHAQYISSIELIRSQAKACKMWLISLALLATFVALLYIYFIWNFNYWKKRGVPGPKPIPVVGAFVGAFMQSTNLVYEIDELYKYYFFSFSMRVIFLNTN